jgi:hypothetical protein
MFEMRVALRRDSALSRRREWVGWAPLCPALAAENGLLVWLRPDVPASDAAALRDCALYADEWEARRRARGDGSRDEVIVEGARGRLVLARRRRGIGVWPRRRSRAERAMRALAEREVRGEAVPARAIGWVEERRRGRIVAEYSISSPCGPEADASEDRGPAFSAATPTRSTSAA